MQMAPQLTYFLVFITYLFYVLFISNYKKYISRVAFHQLKGPLANTQNYPQVKRSQALATQSVVHLPEALVYSLFMLHNKHSKTWQGKQQTLSHSFCMGWAQIHWVPPAQSFLASSLQSPCLFGLQSPWGWIQWEPASKLTRTTCSSWQPGFWLSCCPVIVVPYHVNLTREQPTAWQRALIRESHMPRQKPQSSCYLFSGVTSHHFTIFCSQTRAGN